MEKARYAAFDTHGLPDVLYVGHEEIPSVGADEILVQMQAAGVNAYDVKQRAGRIGAEAKPGTRVGYDGAGEILQVGEAVLDWAPGERVLVRNKLGTASTHMIVRARNLVHVPDDVSLKVAAAIGTPFGVAYQALRSLEVGDGDTLLIHGGSGAVGLAAIQFARHLGAGRIIATSNSRNFDLVTKHGAEPISYGAELGARLNAVLSGDHISVILDASGTEEALASHSLLKDQNRWATVAAGREADECGLRAFGGTSRRKLEREEILLRRAGIEVGLKLISEGAIKVHIGAIFSLEDVAAAHAAYEEKSCHGRIVIIPMLP